jgi:hypothetical protein
MFLCLFAKFKSKLSSRAVAQVAHTAVVHAVEQELARAATTFLHFE